MILRCFLEVFESTTNRVFSDSLNGVPEVGFYVTAFSVSLKKVFMNMLEGVFMYLCTHCRLPEAGLPKFHKGGHYRHSKVNVYERLKESLYMHHEGGIYRPD